MASYSDSESLSNDDDLFMQARLEIMSNTLEIQRNTDEIQQVDEEIPLQVEVPLQICRNVSQKNRLPLRRKFCFQLRFYQDIETDIAVDFQYTARQLYHIWMLHGLLYIFNVTGGISKLDYNVIGVGIFYMLVFTPLSCVCWFRSAYMAMSSGSAFDLMIFSMASVLQFAVTFVHAIGLPYLGTIGVLTALFSYQDGRVFPAVLEFCIGFAFGLAAGLDVYLMVKIIRMFHKATITFSKIPGGSSTYEDSRL